MMKSIDTGFPNRRQRGVLKTLGFLYADGTFPVSRLRGIRYTSQEATS
jgi:hypothetical protein